MKTMWMRSCAVCKSLLRKLRLCDSIRCQCGWEWQGYGTYRPDLGRPVGEEGKQEREQWLT